MNKDRNILLFGSALCSAAVGTVLLTRLRSYPPHEDEVLALFVGRDSIGGVLDTVLKTVGLNRDHPADRLAGGSARRRAAGAGRHGARLG